MILHIHRRLGNVTCADDVLHVHLCEHRDVYGRAQARLRGCVLYTASLFPPIDDLECKQ